MELLFGFISSLGSAGFLFLLLMVGLNLGLTQVVRDLIRSVQRKRARATGDEAPALLGGLAVMLLSTVIGGALGGLMLSAVAGVIGIKEGPSAGVLAGLLLGAATAGIVGYLNQQAERRAAAIRAAGAAQAPAVTPDLLSELVTMAVNARVPAGPSPWGAPVGSAAVDDAVLADPMLRPASPRDVYKTQHDGEEY